MIGGRPQILSRSFARAHSETCGNKFPLLDAAAWGSAEELQSSVQEHDNDVQMDEMVPSPMAPHTGNATTSDS